MICFSHGCCKFTFPFHSILVKHIILPTMKFYIIPKRAVYLLATHIYYNDCKFTVRVFPSDIIADFNWHVTFKVDTFTVMNVVILLIFIPVLSLLYYVINRGYLEVGSGS